MTNKSTQIITDKQPRGLSLLFFTELWERFGFYTVQTIIILYMTQGLHFTDHDANLLYAAFAALLYLTPVVGGYLADRYLGFQRSIILGGILLVIAYVLTALPGTTTFFVGLSVLIIGNGFFKPNVSSIVGELYQENDPRRDGGFTIFYMGINIGALIPPLFAGKVVTHFSWHAGFFLAAIGMAIGQIIFMLGKRKYLGDKGKYPRPTNETISIAKVSYGFYAILFVGIIITAALCNLAFQFPHATNLLIECAAIVIVLVTIYFLLKEPILQRNRMIAALILIAISFGFWALYNQTFTSLMLFADRNMEHNLFGIHLDAEMTQFFNPFFIIALSPLLSSLWIKLSHHGLNPSFQMKFSLGVLMMCVGYILLSFGAHYFNVEGITSPWWLIGSYFFQTTGELLISPVGLSMITVLAPKHLVGMMMGVWFFATSASFAVGGFLANIAAVPGQVKGAASLPYYSHAFLVYGLIALVLTVIAFTFVPFLTKMIEGK